MTKRARRTISVNQYHYDRITASAARLGVSRGSLIEAAVAQLPDLPVAGAPPVMPILDVPPPAPVIDPDFVDIDVSDAVALAVKAIETTIVAHHSQEREVLVSPAFEIAIEAVIARFEACPPLNRSCALCTVTLAPNARRLFLLDTGRYSGTYVWICARCDEQHPRDPDAPRFDGGRDTGEGAANAYRNAARGRVPPKSNAS